MSLYLLTIRSNRTLYTGTEEWKGFEEKRGNVSRPNTPILVLIVKFRFRRDPLVSIMARTWSESPGRPAALRNVSSQRRIPQSSSSALDNLVSLWPRD